MTPEAAEAWLGPVWETHEAIWLVTGPDAGINDPQGEAPAWLSARAVAAEEYPSADKVLRFYARTRERADLAHELAPGSRPPSRRRRRSLGQRPPGGL